MTSFQSLSIPFLSPFQVLFKYFDSQAVSTSLSSIISLICFTFSQLLTLFHFSLWQQIAYEKLCQQVSKLEEVRQSEINLMRHRINDLTVKLSYSERIIRQTQQRKGKNASRKTTNSCSEEGPPAGSFLLEKTTLTVHPMNKDDSETADQEEIQDKSENDSSLSSPTTSEKIMVMIDCSQHEDMLSRLHDLSTCVRKISDSLNSYCDTSNQEKHHHRSLSSILPNLEDREMFKTTWVMNDELERNKKQFPI